MIGKFFVVGRSDGNVLWLCRTSQHIESVDEIVYQCCNSLLPNPRAQVDSQQQCKRVEANFFSPAKTGNERI